MKRREFIVKSASGIAIPLSVPFFSSCNHSSASLWQCTHNNSSLETIIVLDGLSHPFNVMQITDSHISCDNDSDRVYDKYSARMNQAYPLVNHFKTNEKVTPLQCLEELMDIAQKENVALIALTGDIVNYPSATAVEAVRKIVTGAGISHIYVAGNHDWHYEGMKGSANELRQEWCTTRLKPLYAGNNILYSSLVMNGINMITIDNSTYQITEEQLEFYKQQKTRPEPIIVFAHIPFYMPSLRICCGHPEWGATVDRNYELERRERWPESGNNLFTKTFIQEIMTTDRLAGIFTGHWHQSSYIVSADKKQCITAAALNGQYRIIRFIPLI
jgi:predicted MPP superfamily phosphohydrolase